MREPRRPALALLAGLALLGGCGVLDGVTEGRLRSPFVVAAPGVDAGGVDPSGPGDAGPGDRPADGGPGHPADAGPGVAPPLARCGQSCAQDADCGAGVLAPLFRCREQVCVVKVFFDDGTACRVDADCDFVITGGRCAVAADCSSGTSCVVRASDGQGLCTLIPGAPGDCGSPDLEPRTLPAIEGGSAVVCAPRAARCVAHLCNVPASCGGDQPCDDTHGCTDGACTCTDALCQAAGFGRCDVATNGCACADDGECPAGTSCRAVP